MKIYGNGNTSPRVRRLLMPRRFVRPSPHGEGDVGMLQVALCLMGVRLLFPHPVILFLMPRRFVTLSLPTGRQA